MTLSVEKAIGYATHALGSKGKFSPEIDGRSLLNQAGELLVQAHTWKWLERRPAYLNLRGSITVTDASYVDSTKTLTKTGAFTNYTFLEGDVFHLTTGVGLVLGYYKVASKASANAIVLKTSAGGGDATASGTLDLHAIALPADFASPLAWEATTGLVQTLRFTTLDQLIQFRTNQITVSNGIYWVALAYGEPAATGGAPVPLLEIYPTPGANETGTFTLYYRARWQTIDDDQDLISIPSWLEPLYIQVVRAVAKGYEDDFDERLQMQERLGRVWTGPEMAVAKEYDRQFTTWDYGPLQNGAAQMTSVDNFLRTTVAGPS